MKYFQPFLHLQQYVTCSLYIFLGIISIFLLLIRLRKLPAPLNREMLSFVRVYLFGILLTLCIIVDFIFRPQPMKVCIPESTEQALGVLLLTSD